MVKIISTAILILLVFSAPRSAYAQLNGSNLRGDYGVGAGTQPAPGLYVPFMWVKYDTDDLRNRNGDRVGTSGEVDVNAALPLVMWISPFKLLGANYGVVAALPFPDNALAAPLLGVNGSTGFGLGDLYVQPLNLGWHAPRADFVTSVGFYAPTGRYDVDADDNTGLGMISFELAGGTTVFFDEGRSWSAATLASWETHSTKNDTDTKVGDLLTLEGGLGKSFLKGAASVGLAYYAQWKLTSDEFGAQLPDAIATVNKNRVFALGPDLTLPIAVHKKLLALVNVRAMWELNARSTTQGRTLIVTATFPVPSIEIP
jgi:hypothetical protein